MTLGIIGVVIILVQYLYECTSNHEKSIIIISTIPKANRTCPKPEEIYLKIGPPSNSKNHVTANQIIKESSKAKSNGL